MVEEARDRLEASLDVILAAIRHKRALRKRKEAWKETGKVTTALVEGLVWKKGSDTEGRGKSSDDSGRSGAGTRSRLKGEAVRRSEGIAGWKQMYVLAARIHQCLALVLDSMSHPQNKMQNKTPFPAVKRRVPSEGARVRGWGDGWGGSRW